VLLRRKLTVLLAAALVLVMMVAMAPPAFAGSGPGETNRDQFVCGIGPEGAHFLQEDQARPGASEVSRPTDRPLALGCVGKQ
jgi:hypothetical protein